MDWPRAKTILIVALALLNIFLYHQVYGGVGLPAPEESYLTAFPVEALVEELAVYGVQPKIQDGVPPRLPPVRLIPRVPALDLDAVFAGRRYETRQGTLGYCTGTLYSTDEDVLCLSEDGRLVYAVVQRAGVERARRADLDAARQQVEALFEAVGGPPADLHGPEITFDDQGGTFVFRYEQVIEDAAAGPLWIFPGAVEIHATGRRVVSYQQRLWDVETVDAAPAPVMPVTNLLHRQLEDRDRLVDLLEQFGSDRGHRVLQLRLGYALGPAPEAGAPGSGAQPPAYEGRPAWQALLQGAPPLLFDARTGAFIESVWP